MNTILLASLLTFTGTHQGGGNTLYRAGISLKDQAISLRSWGSGICSETEEDAFEGSTSVRVTTKNLFQGGILTWDKTIDLSGSFPDKSNLLRITYKSLDAAVTSGGSQGGRPGGGGGKKGGGGGAGIGDGGGESASEENSMGGDEPFVGDPQQGGGGFGGAPQGGPGGQGVPGGGRPGGQGVPGGGRPGGQGVPGGGRPGGFGGPGGAGQGGTVAPSTLKMMRIIVGTTDGMKSEAFIPAATTVAVDRGWKQAGIPLQAIKGFEKTNKVVKNISFSGDVSTAFYVGDIRVISDKTPIRAEPSFRTALVDINKIVTFSASGFGGSSILKYSWDFDDADGIQIDAEGSTVKYRFRTPSNDQIHPSTMRPNGEFTVTLTVSDAYGLKDPYSTTIKVKVNP